MVSTSDERSARAVVVGPDCGRFDGVKRVLTLIVFALTAGSILGQASLPGPEAMLSEAEVRSRFFAYSLGLVVHDITAYIPRSHLSTLFAEYEASADIPFQEIRGIERRRLSGGERLLTASFERDFDFPLPYTFFGIPLGEVTTTRRVAFRETIVGRAAYRNALGDSVTLEAVHEFRVSAGNLRIDFRQWVDFILGRFVEDLDIIAGLVFRHEGAWYALVGGRDTEGRFRAGGYDFTNDKGLIPVPDKFAGIANRLAKEYAARGK
mgnify:CR=1 FL=1